MSVQAAPSTFCIARCENCGEPFTARITRGRAQKYCGKKECRLEVHRARQNEYYSRQRHTTHPGGVYRIEHDPSGDYPRGAEFDGENFRWTMRAGNFEPGTIFRNAGRRLEVVQRENKLVLEER